MLLEQEGAFVVKRREICFRGPSEQWVHSRFACRWLMLHRSCGHCSPAMEAPVTGLRREAGKPFILLLQVPAGHEENQIAPY